MSCFWGACAWDVPRMPVHELFLVFLCLSCSWCACVWAVPNVPVNELFLVCLCMSCSWCACVWAVPGVPVYDLLMVCLCMSCSCCACVWAVPGVQNYSLFLVCRCLVGVGEASYSTIAPTLISDMFVSDQRSKMLAFFYFAIPVGRYDVSNLASVIPQDRYNTSMQICIISVCIHTIQRWQYTAIAHTIAVGCCNISEQV